MNIVFAKRAGMSIIPAEMKSGNSMTDRTDRVEDQLVAFLPNLRRFAISLCGSRDVADDLVQAACERGRGRAARGGTGTRCV